MYIIRINKSLGQRSCYIYMGAKLFNLLTEDKIPIKLLKTGRVFKYKPVARHQEHTKQILGQVEKIYRKQSEIVLNEEYERLLEEVKNLGAE